jgi:hypothetical protein
MTTKDNNETVNEQNNDKEEVSMRELLGKLLYGYGESGSEMDKTIVRDMLKIYVKQVMSKYSVANKYNVLILFDSSTLIKSDADNIYKAVNKFTEKRPLLLILYSYGGQIGSGYLIGKLCREYANKTFVVAVPRQAKSAATLICCGADEIHMGSMSELGPIDPQINNLPALGLKNSIEHIAKLVKETPESAEMFAKYLYYSLKPIDIGYYERVAESALQYAQKLLETHSEKLPAKSDKIAYDLVYMYKDHGFVIDKSDAINMFSDKVIKHNTEEYKLANRIYEDFVLIENIANYLGYSFYYIGSVETDPIFNKKR